MYKRGFVPILVLLGALIIGGLFFIAQPFFTKEPIYDESNMGNSPDSSQESSPITTKWYVYTNTKYKFETKYDPQSPPIEEEGNKDQGQFTYLQLIKFGTVSPKFPYSYEVRITKQQPIQNFKLELVGHITDAVDSEETVTFNSIDWTKLKYKQLIATQNVVVELAIANNNNYSFAITALETNMDKILSTFYFTDRVSLDQCIQKQNDYITEHKVNLTSGLIISFNDSVEVATQKKILSSFGLRITNEYSSINAVAVDVPLSEAASMRCKLQVDSNIKSVNFNSIGRAN